MSNPSQRLDDLLATSGAVLVRDKNHRAYKLNNGRTFVTAKTPSDWRSTLNNISGLRRRAGLTPPAKQPAPPAVAAPTYPIPQPALAPPPPPTIEPPTAAHAPTELSRHLDGLIADGEALMIELTDQAATIERQVTLLKTIRAHAEDPLTPALLMLISPQQQQPEPAPPPPPPPPPPPQIVITRKHTEAVIAQLPKDTFTIQDVFEGLVNGAIHHIPAHEQRRLKNMVSMQLHYLNHNGGNISILKGGRGGVMTVWQKDDPNQLGTRVEISSHDQAATTPDEPPQET